MEHIKVIPEVDPEIPTVGKYWSAQSIEKIDDHLYKISNLKSECGITDAPTNQLSGSYYITEYNNFYWHFIHEDLAGYEGIKELVPELKLVLLDSQGFMDGPAKTNPGHKHFPYLEYFAELYSISSIPDINNENWVFETVYFTTSSTEFLSDPDFWGEVLPMSVWPSPEFDDWDKTIWIDRSPYSVKGLNKLTEKIKSDISVDDSLPKKIFISRKDVNKRLLELVGKPGYEHLVEERLFEAKFIEDYFEARGYLVVALEDYDYKTQMQFFMGATDIAGTVGAGFANLHMSNPGTKLYELHVIPIYGFDYGYYKNFRDIDYIPVELRNLSEAKTLGETEILEVLDGLGI